jgi:hypothetical protein
VGKKISVFRGEDNVEYLKKYLLEAVREVMFAEEEGEEADKGAIEQLLKFLKDNGYGSAEFTGLGSKTGRATITNLGSKDEREKIQALLRDKGINFSADSYKRITIGDQTFDLQQGKPAGAPAAAAGPACEKMSSTAFEGNVIYGLKYGGTESKDKGRIKLANSFLAKAKTGKSDIVCTPDALKKGTEIADTLIPLVQTAGLNPAETFPTSGGRGGSVSLTKTYVDHGVKSTEAKADVAIGTTGISVKQLEEAQFMSAQGPELGAIIDVAMKFVAKENQENLDDVIDRFTDKLERSVGVGTKKHAKVPKDKEAYAANPASYAGGFETEDIPLKKGEKKPERGEPRPQRVKYGAGEAAVYDVRDKLKGVKKLKSGEEKEDVTVYQKLLNKFFHFDTTDPEKDISPEDQQKLKNAFSGTTVEGFSELRDQVEHIVTSQSFKKALCKEAITGEFRFNEDLPKARALLKWSVGSPTSSHFRLLTTDGGNWDEGFFDSVAANVKLEIRSRGEADLRGLAARGEFGKGTMKESIDSIENHIFSESDLKDIEVHSKQIYERLTGSQIIQEGILGDIGSAIGKGKDWIKDKASQITKAISGFVARIAKWLKNVLNKGLSYLLQFLGLEPVSFEVKY